MSLLTASPPALYPSTEQLNVVGHRYVDPAVRLHNWSLPCPRCIHGAQLGESCAACDAELADD
ncbi:MAG: hypothetical protein QOH73_2715 [Gaiellaceae bacterium]|jgi:hypothetical protein|nr:hypothetical protein [Gaiellaceae bacterium]